MADIADVTGVAEPDGAAARRLADVPIPALAQRARTATPDDVAEALQRPRIELPDLAALLSPAAGSELERLATRARDVTVQRFGRTIRLFAPLYLSNHCLSTCTYCGFARGLPVARNTLTPEQVHREAATLVDRGFRHLLLVSGEHRGEVSPRYLADCLHQLHHLVPSISIETQTWGADDYRALVDAGLDGVVHYQETYDRQRYQQVHRLGWKRHYDRRLHAVDAAARAGARRVGIGVLLGLHTDWRADVLALAAHAHLLQRHHWRTEVTVSLPRIRPSASGFQPVVDVGDAEFVQAVCALRLMLPDAGIVLSTRERPALRDGLVRIAVTHMSAGSSTAPGGYAEPAESQEQFSVTDERSPREVARVIAAAGYDPVFHDALPGDVRVAPVG